jgi:hypothetical protein
MELKYLLAILLVRVVLTTTRMITMSWSFMQYIAVAYFDACS